MSARSNDHLPIAVVHEWVDAYAGSEQVFEAIAATFPNADLLALTYEPKVRLALGGRCVRTTFLDRPSLRNRRSLTLPLMPAAWRALGKSKYDVVITSHHAFAHTNRLADGGVHLCYVHSPARYLWSPDIDGRGSARALGVARAALRRIDLAASKRVTAYAANSSAVARRIEQFWHRESEVIHPPVRVEFFAEPAPQPPTRDYILGVGRWIPYKNLHLVIEVANLADMPVKIAGRGPDKSRIVEAARGARVPVEIIESPTDEELRVLYQNASCLVFPTIEDFGIVPVEAQAAGTPVVALAAGGALDTVVHGTTGILVPDSDLVGLSRAALDAAHLRQADIAQHAQRFTRGVFVDSVRRWTDDNT